MAAVKRSRSVAGVRNARDRARGGLRRRVLGRPGRAGGDVAVRCHKVKDVPAWALRADPG